MKIPKHIGIIPDGNRRWAVSSGMGKHEGYDHGLTPGLELLLLARELGVQEISYYGFTVDNCRRPTRQIESFSKACVDAVNLIAAQGVSLLVVGDSNSKFFPKELKPYTTRTDIAGGGIKVNFLVNYGWEWDLSGITDGGSKKLATQIKSHDVSRMDMVIRWGGMRRLSGFLPVQSVYADFYVVEELWPDFKPQHFLDAMEWYQRQDPTLGG